MRINIRLLTKTAKIPQKMSNQAAGYDLFADIENDILLKPLERKLISTGVAVAIPDLYEAQIRPRSGLAINNGISVLNSPGTIDPDYRGEIKIALINLSNEDFIVKSGMRIAQMIISKFEEIDFVEVDELNDTQRGTDGFGSTS